MERTACLSDLGKVLEVSLREHGVVVHVQAGALPAGHRGAEEAAVPVVPRVEHDAHRASSSVVGVLHELAQDAARHMICALHQRGRDLEDSSSRGEEQANTHAVLSIERRFLVAPRYFRRRDERKQRAKRTSKRA